MLVSNASLRRDDEERPAVAWRDEAGRLRVPRDTSSAEVKTIRRLELMNRGKFYRWTSVRTKLDERRTSPRKHRVFSAISAFSAVQRRGCSRLVMTRVEFRTRDVGVPVDEGAERIVLPRPDVQLVEGRQAVAIRRADELKVLPHQHGRRAVRVARVPLVREHEKLDADEVQLRPSLLVDQQFGC